MEKESLRAVIADETPRLVEIRRDLHRHPELGYHEHRTGKVVQHELSMLDVEHVSGVAQGVGVVAHLPATVDDPAEPIAIRADMDALPIDECTGVEYTSQNTGVMHACGHDGHTAMLLGAVKALARIRQRPRAVTFLFQPAEEGGAGGLALCRAGALDGTLIGPQVRAVFGLHCWPELSVGHVSTRPGPLMAAVDTFRVGIRGVGGHAAYPHKLRDPVIAVTNIVSTLQSVVSRNVDPAREAVLSITAINGGRAENVIPDEMSFLGTCRSHDDHVRVLLRDRFHEIVQQTAVAHGCHAEIDWNVQYPVTRNDPALTERFRELAIDEFGRDRVSHIERPHMGGEDFAYYGAYAPTVFFLLGIRPSQASTYPMLHQPDFNFNDDAIPAGVEMFCRIALEPAPLIEASTGGGARAAMTVGG